MSLVSVCLCCLPSIVVQILHGVNLINSGSAALRVLSNSLHQLSHVMSVGALQDCFICAILCWKSMFLQFLHVPIVMAMWQIQSTVHAACYIGKSCHCGPSPPKNHVHGSRFNWLSSASLLFGFQRLPGTCTHRCPPLATAQQC